MRDIHWDKKRILFGFLVLSLLLMVPTVIASSETVVSYQVATEDVFPGLADIDATIILTCSVVFNSSDGTVLPNNSMEYSIGVEPGSGTLDVNYNIDRPLIKKSGSPQVSLDPTWLLGDSPPIPVFDDGTIRITLTIHGHLNAEVVAFGNGSATPSDVTWSTWETKTLTVSADASAEDGQTITIQTATRYEAYFTVTVELLTTSYEVTRDSPTKEVTGSPTIQQPIHIIPEFQALSLLLTFLALSIVIVFTSRRLTRTEHRSI